MSEKNRKFVELRTAIAPLWGEPLILDFPVTSIVVWNKSNATGETLPSEPIEWSYDAKDANDVEGKLDPGEALSQDKLADGLEKLYVRSAGGGRLVRVWLWLRGPGG